MVLVAFNFSSRLVVGALGLENFLAVPGLTHSLHSWFHDSPLCHFTFHQIQTAALYEGDSPPIQSSIPLHSSCCFKQRVPTQD